MTLEENIRSLIRQYQNCSRKARKRASVSATAAETSKWETMAEDFDLFTIELQTAIEDADDIN